MDLTLYEKRLGASNYIDAYKQDTSNVINSIFENSPAFKQILVEGTITDSIVNNTSKSTELDALFRPYTKIQKGLYVEIESKIYMVVEYTPNEIYPKAKLELCNSTLKWKESEDVLHEYKCIIKESTFKNTLDKEQVYSSNMNLVVLVKYDENTEKIDFNQRFIFNGKAYEVEAIDTTSHVYDDEGFVKFSVKMVSISNDDDIENDIADKDDNSSGWGEW